jgi:xanthine dehydrogenase molybdopterin-binding subunit B
LSELQASGEALYTSDLGVGSGQLYAATVATTQAAARIVSVDASAAEQVRNVLAVACRSLAVLTLPRRSSGPAYKCSCLPACTSVRTSMCIRTLKSAQSCAEFAMTTNFIILLPAPEQVPGFVAFITAADIPDGGSRDVFGDALFATDFAAYAGQRFGLAVADSQVRASFCGQAIPACILRQGWEQVDRQQSWEAVVREVWLQWCQPCATAGGASDASTHSKFVKL